MKGVGTALDRLPGRLFSDPRRGVLGRRKPAEWGPHPRAKQPTWSPSGGLGENGWGAEGRKRQDSGVAELAAVGAGSSHPTAHCQAGEAHFPPTQTGRRQERGLRVFAGVRKQVRTLEEPGVEGEGGKVIPNFPHRAFPAIESTHLSLFSGLEFHF